LLKTALSHLSPATAINLIRLDAFLEGKKVAKTRVSRFAALGPVELAGYLEGWPTVSKFWMTHACITT
jgi:hypothetical protein